MENENTPEYFTLNIERCIADKQVPAVIRQLFIELRDHGYVHVGKFYGELSDIDLDTLTTLAEQTHPEAVVTQEEQDRAYEHMALLGMALLVGEGQELNEETCENSLKLVIAYTAIEGLFRAGLVEVIRDNWSMVGDEKLPLVKLKDQ